jgi:hypothetical protein
VRYLEYEKLSGRIVGELSLPGPLPEVYQKPESLTAYLEAAPDLVIDFREYLVRDGELVRAYDTTEERREKERAAEMRRQEGLARLKGLAFDYVFALLDEDEARQEELRQEYSDIKGSV